MNRYEALLTDAITRHKEGELMFAGKTLLIIGGTGTFGNAVLRRFLQTDIGQIRIFSRDEKKQHDMRSNHIPVREDQG